MDPATEAKKLRQLCILLRKELAAQRSKVWATCWPMLPDQASHHSISICMHPAQL